MSKPTALSIQQIQRVYQEADCLCSAAEIEAAIDQMAMAISEEYAERNPLAIAVLNGGMVFAGKLLPKLVFPLELDYLHVSRYRAETTGGKLDWLVSPRSDLKSRHILLLDDILDEGHTLQAIVRYCRDAGAASVKTAVLVDKEHDRKAEPGLRADFEGVRVADRFVFGFGMDYQGYWRNAPGIFAVKGL